MIRRPLTARGDMEIDLAHSAPVVLRPRRGSGYEIARVPLVTPVTIRKVPTKAFEPIGVKVGEQRLTLHAFEGRFWRMSAFGMTTEHSVSAFASRDPLFPLRGEYEDLYLDPARILPDEGTFLGFHPEMPEGAADRIVVDHSRSVASGMARRFRDRIAHDGETVWVAVAPPLMSPWGGTLQERAAAVKSRDNVYGGERRRFMANHPVGLRAGHAAVEELIAWRAAALAELRGGAGRRYPKEVSDDGLREMAGALGTALKGIGDPDADIGRYVRTIASGILPVADTILKYRTRERPKLAGDAAADIHARIAALLPYSTLAMVDMVPEEDRAIVIDQADGLLRKLEPHLPRTGSYAITYVRSHIGFIRNVVRPRMGVAIPEADEESLMALGSP